MEREDILRHAPDDAVRARWATFLDTLDAIHAVVPSVDGWAVLREGEIVWCHGCPAIDLSRLVAHEDAMVVFTTVPAPCVEVPLQRGPGRMALYPVAAALAFAAMVAERDGAQYVGYVATNPQTGFVVT